MKRAALSLLGAAFALTGCRGASPGSSPTTAMEDRAASPELDTTSPADALIDSQVTGAETAPTGAAHEDVSDLVGRNWVLIAASAVGGSDPNERSAQMRFTDNGDGTGQVSLTGCAVGTFPVSFKADRELVFGRSLDVSVCANAVDVGHSLPRIMALPLRWSADGEELILDRPMTSDLTLVLSEDGRLAPAEFCLLARRAIDGRLDFTDPERVAELTGFPGLTRRQRSLVSTGAVAAVRQVASGAGWSNDELVVAVNEACGLHLTPSMLVP